MQRRTWILAPLGLALGRFAHAQAEWPSRPIRLVMPYAAGGGVDSTTRKLADKLGPLLGQPVFVENKVGAGGTLGAEYVAQARPDGYTLLFATSSFVTLRAMSPQLRFDPLTSFEHVTRTSAAPCVLVVSADSPYRSVEDLVAAARQQAGRLNYASGGISTPSHLAGAALVTHLKLKCTHVPYRGSVDIGPSLITGDTQFGFPVPSTAIPYIRQGKLRALAVTGQTRLPQLPDVPTLEEVYKASELVIDTWGGIWAPAGTPRIVVDKLNAAVLKALAQKDVAAHYESSGSQISPSRTPAEFTRFLQAETIKYGKLVAAAGITAN